MKPPVIGTARAYERLRHRAVCQSVGNKRMEERLCAIFGGIDWKLGLSKPDMHVEYCSEVIRSLRGRSMSRN